MQILNCLIGVPKGLDYNLILEAMNGDCHNPNLPYNLYLYNNLIPNKAIKVPLNHKMS